MKNRSIVPLLKKEYFSIFTSPFFYIITILFCVISSSQFFFFQQFFVEGIGTTNLTRFFTAIPYVLCIILPSISIKNKTALDLSLPYSALQQIFAKWISIFTEFIFMLLPLVLVPICVSHFGDIDFAQTLCGFIGIILYASAAISFCVLFSEIFVNRSAFFITTSFSLFAINLIHTLPSFFQVPQFFLKIIQSVSFSWHFDSASKYHS